MIEGPHAGSRLIERSSDLDLHVEHLERSARIERVQPRRAATYLERLALLNHVLEIVDRPIKEPMPAPPNLPMRDGCG